MSSASAGGSYPGNPSLPVEVREKILMTFRHALGLFSSGHVSDCLIGCEFILKMDPRFTPAKRLQEKVRNRDSDVDISELQALVEPGAAASSPAPARSGSAAPKPAPASPPPPRVSAASPPPARPPAAPAPPAPAARTEKPEAERLIAEAGRKYGERDFDGAIAAASRVLALLPGNRDALAIVEKAAGRKATAPLVEASRERIEEALGESRLGEARLELERIRSLDPDHPAIAELERRLSPPGAARPPFDSAEEFPLEHEEPAAGAPDEPAPEAGTQASPAASAEDSPPGPAEGGPAVASPSDSAGSGDALVPPLPPSPDLFLSLEGEAGAPPPTESFSDEEEAEAAAREIGALLKQGDEISKKGDRQQAIEIWSRVFLIDINNAEAVTRIEKARQEIAEEGRIVADLLKKGRDAFEVGDRAGAREFFLQAQALDPDEATARFYLERIQKETDAPAAPATPTPLGKAGSSPQPSGSAPGMEDAVVPAPPRRAGFSIQPRVLAVVGAFLALTLVGIYFVFKGKSQEAPAKIDSGASIAHARELLGKGKIAEARAELRRIGPADPGAAEAQKMLAELSHSGGAEASGKSVPPAGAASAASREARGDTDPARLRAAAEKALSEKRYIEALKNFNLAAPAFRDDPNFTQQQGLAAEKVTALTPAVKFYNEGEYETAIPILWRIVQEDRDNADARSYLLRSYYNQGISQLQNGLYPKAMQAFQEALAIDPNDAEAARHRKFAERYQKGDLDLMGRIYVRHLSHRP